MSNHQPYEPEHRYRVPCVPCVRGEWQGLVRWWVVFLPIHEDAKFFRFDEPHYHVHPQFVPPNLWQSHAVNASPRGAGWYRYPLHAMKAADRADGKDVPLEGPVFRRRKCYRPMPLHPSALGWHEQTHEPLRRHYAGRRLNCGQCPHRGIDLSNVPETNGQVVCPGHGLVFRDGVCTGKTL